MSDDGDGARDPHVNDANGDANDARCGMSSPLAKKRGTSQQDYFQTYHCHSYSSYLFQSCNVPPFSHG